MKKSTSAIILLLTILYSSPILVKADTSQQSVATFLINTDSTQFWAVAQNGTIYWSSTNATYTIQSALGNITSGGTVQLGVGQFPVSGLYITNTIAQRAIRLTGAGEYQSTLVLEDNSPGQTSQSNDYTEGFSAVIFAEGINDNTPINIAIDNIGISGDRANQNKDIAGIVVRGAEFSIHDNYLINCGGHGIVAVPPEWLVVKEIYHNIIYYTNMHGANPIVPPEPVETNMSGIYCYDVDSTIYGNYVGWTGWVGDIPDMNFTGVGISLFVTDNCHDNWMWGDRYGIKATDAQQLMITNNFVDGNKEAGIYLWNVQVALVSNNEIRPTFNLVGNALAGIVIAGNSSYNTISNNKIWSWCIDNINTFNTTFGIEEQDSADYNTIMDNDVIQNQTTFVSDSITNYVGNVRNPYHIIGAHTVLANNIPNISNVASTNSLDFGQWGPLIVVIVAFGIFLLLIRMIRRSHAYSKNKVLKIPPS